MERKLVSIHEAAQFLGVTPTTLRRWEREGRLLPDARTRGGDRRYDLNRLGSEPQGSDHPCDRQVAVLVSESLTRASFLVQVR